MQKVRLHSLVDEQMTGYNQLTDHELVILLNRGDQNPFAQIYDRYKFILHAHAVNKPRDPEEARDIIQ